MEQTSALSHMHNAIRWNSPLSSRVSMTSLLMHTIEHSTRLFLAHKQKPAHEKVFKSCSQLSKSRQKMDVILENVRV